MTSFLDTGQLKLTIKAQISERMASVGLSDHFSILGENLSEEVYDDYDNYYYNRKNIY